MMDQTVNRGYPYPQCDPPLTKDASDIAHLFNLANAVDIDVQNTYDQADDVVVRPDAARMTMSLTLASTENNVIPVFDQATFDTTGTLMADTATGLIRLPEAGWYSIGCTVTMTTATYLAARARFLMNGVAITSWSPPAEIVASNQQLVNLIAEAVAPVGGNTLTIEVRNGAALPNYTYAARIWADQTVKL